MAGPITVAYYYRVRWGALDEFIELFERNHWPILRDQLAAGRFLDVSAATPRFHGDGRADWNFLVTITFRDWAAMEDHSEAEIAARLFPDQERFAAEERRRFELLEAHWDVPLEDQPLPEEWAMELGFPSWVGVVCEDLDAQRRFYEDVLGMRAVGEGENWIHFDLGTGPDFELLRRSTEPQYDAARYQVGFAVDDIEVARQELIARGVMPISDIVGTKGGGRWAYFRDPEGNVFEIKEGADPA